MSSLRKIKINIHASATPSSLEQHRPKRTQVVEPGRTYQIPNFHFHIEKSATILYQLRILSLALTIMLLCVAIFAGTIGKCQCT